MLHKYPKDLVDKIVELWQTTLSAKGRKADRTFELPAVEILEQLVSTCYQVSHMKEESRGLRFRVMLCEPEAFNTKCFGPSSGPAMNTRS